VQSEASLCVVLDMELVRSEVARVPNKIYYQLESAKDANDWKELLSVISINSVGTCEFSCFMTCAIMIGVRGLMFC
jgi:hypothetical protein